MAKLKIWHQGERSEALCSTCGEWRETEFQYRTFRLEKSRQDVPDVLVAVCRTCDSIAAVPHQSAPRLQAARRGVPGRIDVRVPKELRDVIGLLAVEFGGDPVAFAGGVVRYYLHELVESKALARRVAALATSDEAGGTPGGRLALRLDRRLLDDAMKAAGRVRVRDKSALVRGIIVVAKQDAYDAPDEDRRAALRAIAVAAGA